MGTPHPHSPALAVSRTGGSVPVPGQVWAECPGFSGAVGASLLEGT